GNGTGVVPVLRVATLPPDPAYLVIRPLQSFGPRVKRPCAGRADIESGNVATPSGVFDRSAIQDGSGLRRRGSLRVPQGACFRWFNLSGPGSPSYAYTYS